MFYPYCFYSKIHYYRAFSYDDVTHYNTLGFQRKISIHIAFGPLLFWPLLSMTWNHVLFVKEYQRNMWNKRKMAVSLQHWEKSVKSEANGCVLDTFWVEWSLNSCKFQVRNIFSVFEKILRGTKVYLLVDFSCKIHLQDTLVHMRGRHYWFTVWAFCRYSKLILGFCYKASQIFIIS